ncbi:hypothetical protein [Streptomyces sp. NPDC050388]|uniref:hypothetical protein n=1 Tax=Streptomyces sp. NPDC050388 TaxID=3155781 RepID=UPI003438E46B
MAASRMVWGQPDPNLELAAEAGVVGALKALGKRLHESHGGLEHAERWLLAAAEAGDREGAGSREFDSQRRQNS